MIQAIRGTYDVLPADVGIWHALENRLRQTFHLYGFGEIRTPMFEATELFVRGVGEETDIVSKEMYTFTDRDESKSLTLRPEGTAAVMRAYIERQLHTEARMLKLYYIGPMFRRERPQKGRYRQHVQAGAEVKPGVRIVNAARGGIVDESALAIAIKEGRVGGAGIDVFATEPCTASPLFDLDQVVVTPHLGASTDEAQEKAGVAVAKSVRLALAGELVPDAVNVQGGTIAEDVRPGLPLAERLGRIFTALAGAAPTQLDVIVRGDITQYDVKVLELAALKGVFADVVEHSVSYVNAPLLATERGMEVRLTTSSESPDYRNMTTVRGVLADGTVVSVSGTVSGPRLIEKIVEVNDFQLDVTIAENLLFLRYTDRPGVVGQLGGILGAAGINIGGMQVARAAKGGEALVALTVDSPVPAALVEEIKTAIGATAAHSISLES